MVFNDPAKECIKHPGKKQYWTCLDPNCAKETSSCCILCVKNDHSNCKDDLLLNPEQFKEKVQIMESSFDNKMYINKVSSDLAEKTSVFNQNLSQKQSAIIDAIKLNSDTSKLDVATVCNMKKHLNIKWNKEIEKIEISSKIEINEDNLPLSIEKFNKKLEDTFNGFLKDFSGLKFTACGSKSLSADEWTGHANVGLSNEDGGIKVFRNKIDSSFGYFCILDTLPIAEACSFKLTITGVYEPDRFLDWGIVDKTKYDAIVSANYVNGWASGGISFCGYNYGGGLSGVNRTMTSSDASGYKVGDYTYMEYSKGNEIRFWNEDLTNNLTMKNLPNEDYYMYFVVYHPQTTGFLERLS